MPHHKSCKKRMKTSGQRRLSNRENRTELRSLIKRFKTLSIGEDKTTDSLIRIYSILDVQARKGVIPKSRASRLKARMAALYAK